MRRSLGVGPGGGEGDKAAAPGRGVGGDGPARHLEDGRRGGRVGVAPGPQAEAPPPPAAGIAGGGVVLSTNNFRKSIQTKYAENRNTKNYHFENK